LQQQQHPQNDKERLKEEQTDLARWMKNRNADLAIGVHVRMKQRLHKRHLRRFEGVPSRNACDGEQHVVSAGGECPDEQQVLSVPMSSAW
jgi:hypothetical protein